MSTYLTLKNFVIAAIVVVVVAGILAFGTVYFFSKKTPELSLSPTTPPPSSVIGKTTSEELRVRAGLIAERQLPDGGSEFLFESGIYLHPEIIIAREGVAVYESSPVDPDAFDNPADYPMIDEYLAQYGSPALTFEGSAGYGPFMRTYVYPSYGFAFVGNPATGEVFELEYFVPMTSSEYADVYGARIQVVEDEEREL